MDLSVFVTTSTPQCRVEVSSECLSYISMTRVCVCVCVCVCVRACVCACVIHPLTYGYTLQCIFIMSLNDTLYIECIYVTYVLIDLTCINKCVVLHIE